MNSCSLCFLYQTIPRTQNFGRLTTPLVTVHKSIPCKRSAADGESFERPWGRSTSTHTLLCEGLL